jgi:hypothetical protein
LRRIRWLGVVTGVGVSLVVAVLFNLFVFSVIDARLYRVFIAEGGRGDRARGCFVRHP